MAVGKAAAARPRSRADFDVLIVCALKHEANAVIDLLDHCWDNDNDLFDLGSYSNEYVLGCLGQHNVVILLLPGMGKCGASSGAARVESTFPNIRLALVVGICGVSPLDNHGEEIVLGDVVISTQVIRADFGRQYADGFQRKGTLDSSLSRPPKELQSMLNRLELDRYRQQLEQGLQVHIRELQGRKKKAYSYPGVEHDRLYPADFLHKHNPLAGCPVCGTDRKKGQDSCQTAKDSSCDDLGCSDNHPVHRDRLSRASLPAIHFGCIASGDAVVKSAQHRNQLHVADEVIAFEMEGSGVWDIFPTVVIKSGCDYADSHKNKIWQNYSAAVAAACTKAFLQQWTPVRAAKASPERESEMFQPRILPSRSGSRFFRGREEEMARMESQLLETDQGQRSKKPQVAVLLGIGGCGKSELCIQYMEAHDDDYWGLFWIDGTSTASLKAGYTKLGQELRLSNGEVSTVHLHLARQAHPWLLVVDNADDPGLDLDSFLPSRGAGHVLITTRNPELEQYGTVQTLHIDGLPVEEAQQLLCSLAGATADTQKARAAEIVRELNCHTLAITQAASFLKETRDWNSYLGYYRENRKKMLSYKQNQTQSLYGSVYSTFEVSAAYLQRQADQDGITAARDALDLLHRIAFMDSQGKFEKIFSNARTFARPHSSGNPGDLLSEDGLPSDKDVPEETAICKSKTQDSGPEQINAITWPLFAQTHANLLPAVAYAADDASGKVRWRQACHKLQQFSLVRVSLDGFEEESLDFHPLVQSWALARQDDELQRQSWLSSATIVCLAAHGHIAYDPLLDDLKDHIRVCANHASLGWWTARRWFEHLFILYYLGAIIYQNLDDLEIQNSRICRVLEETVAAIQRDGLVITHVELVKTLIGEQALTEGNTQKAIAIMLEVKDHYQRTLPETHHLRLFADHELARAYYHHGQLQLAIGLLEHVLDVYKHKHEEDSFVALITEQELAKVYTENGQASDAIRLLERVVQLRRQQLPETHPYRLISEHELASAYRTNRQYADAIAILEHVVRMRSQTLPETHLKRILSERELAEAYRDTRQYADAIQLLEKVVEVERQTLSETHPEHLTSLHALATVYIYNKQLPDAVAVLEHVVSARRRTLPEAHGARIASESTLATAYVNSRRLKDGISLKQHIVQIQARTKPELNIDRIRCEHGLGIAYQMNGQVEDAIAQLSSVNDRLDQIPDEFYTCRICVKRDLAELYQINGQMRHAIRLLEDVLHGQQLVRTSDDPILLGTQRNLEQSYRHVGRLVEAQLLLVQMASAQGLSLPEVEPAVSSLEKEHAEDSTQALEQELALTLLL